MMKSSDGPFAPTTAEAKGKTRAPLWAVLKTPLISRFALPSAIHFKAAACLAASHAGTAVVMKLWIAFLALLQVLAMDSNGCPAGS